MKQRIRLTESDLHRIVMESVNRILNENEENEGLFGWFKKNKNKQAAPAPQRKSASQYEQQASQRRNYEKLVEKCAKLQCEMARIGDSSDPEYRELSQEFDDTKRQAIYAQSMGDPDFDQLKSKYLDEMGYYNIKPYRSRVGYAHAGETYYGGTSGYDAGLR